MEGQRISLADVRSGGEEPLPSPDTTGASWVASANGQAIDFGDPGAKPFLTLACAMKAGQAQVTVIRHAPARPGEKALFPVIGNGKISRFAVDATLAGREWRWQGTLPADDAQLAVFEGPNRLEATLPGGGTVKVAGSGMPREFLTRCRNGAKPAGAPPTAR